MLSSRHSIKNTVTVSLKLMFALNIADITVKILSILSYAVKKIFNIDRS